MREHVRGVAFCLMIATTLHSIAVGNLLPAWVHIVCVDINPSTVIKLADRGSFQTVGLVTDVGLFLEQLANELETRSLRPRGRLRSGPSRPRQRVRRDYSSRTSTVFAAVHCLTPSSWAAMRRGSSGGA